MITHNSTEGCPRRAITAAEHYTVNQGLPISYIRAKVQIKHLSRGTEAHTPLLSPISIPLGILPFLSRIILDPLPRLSSSRPLYFVSFPNYYPKLLLFFSPSFSPLSFPFPLIGSDSQISEHLFSSL